MKFNSPSEIREHLKGVSISPELSICLLIGLSLILSLMVSSIIMIPVLLVLGLGFVSFFTMCILVGVMSVMLGYLLYITGRVEIPPASKGVLMVFGKRRLSSRYLKKLSSLLDEGEWFLIPGIFSALLVNFEEHPAELEKTVVRVPIDPSIKANDSDGVFSKLNFINILFERTSIQFMISDPFAYINVGAEGFFKELGYVIEEILRDIATRKNTSTIYEADLDKEVLKGLLEYKHSSGERIVERWGILPLNVNFQGINPEDPEIKAALEGQYKELLNRLEETTQAETFATIVDKVRAKAPNASEAYVLGVAMRLINGLTIPGRDVFVQTEGGSGDGSNFGLAAAILNNQNQQGGSI